MKITLRHQGQSRLLGSYLSPCVTDIEMNETWTDRDIHGIIVESCWYILCRKIIGCITDDQRGLSHAGITDDHTGDMSTGVLGLDRWWRRDKRQRGAVGGDRAWWLCGWRWDRLETVWTHFLKQTDRIDSTEARRQTLENHRYYEKCPSEVWTRRRRREREGIGWSFWGQQLTSVAVKIFSGRRRRNLFHLWSVEGQWTTELIECWWLFTYQQCYQ